MKKYLIKLKSSFALLQLTTLPLFIFLSTLSLHAQEIKQKPVDKLLPSLALQLRTSKPTGIGLYTVSVTDLQQIKTTVASNKSIRIVSIYEPAKIIVLETNWTEIEKLLQLPFIRSVDTKKKPTEELLFGFVDYAANRISTIQHYYKQYNAANVNVSIKEQKFDSNDIDLRGRILSSSFAATSTSNHASIMATMLAGGGNTWYNTKGAAWGAQLSSADFSNLLPEPKSYYSNSSILLQNHSYGTIVESYYGAEAVGYDASVIANPSLLHIFSAGNSGSQAAPTGAYAGLNGYSNLTGNFKHAKNIITVGHTDTFGVVLTPSSKGPAFDGRVKPELVAFGEDGSSGAAALVSGIGAVVHDVYKRLHANTSAPASLIKAVLLNSADDVETPGIDFKSGYGSANAYAAIQTMVNNHYFTGSVSNNTQQSFTLTVPANSKLLKLTLVWTDPPAAPNAAKALVNDLDLTIALGSTTWQPWVLNSTANINSLQQLPVRKRDSLNVVEQITIDNPVAGDYTVTVHGFAIPAGLQNFAIAYQVDTADRFTWQFPTASDHLFPGQQNVLRFQSTFSNTTGTLQLSTDDGTSWQTISTAVDLTRGYYKLQTANTISHALLRMTINSSAFTSDTFTISQRINSVVGFNCADSVLFSWPAVPGATGYRIAQLGNQYMEPFRTTTDTFVVLSKQSNPSKHYSVTPLLASAAAVRTYTFNYELQGTGCYVRNFIADKAGVNQGLLYLETGTGYLVKSIRFEKFTANGFVLLEQKPFTGSLQFTATDPSLINGNNLYRAIVELTDGRKYYSDTANIYNTGNRNAVVYPNPVPYNGSVTVLTELDEDVLFQLIDNYGRVVLQQPVNDYPQQINVYNLQRGIYYYRLLRKNKKVQTGIMLIQ